jgi:PTS system beta-glucosides-specific IIC component
MIGGGVGGLFAGIVKLKQYVIASPGVATLPTFIPPDGNMTNFWMAIVTVIIAVSVTFVATWFLGFKDPVEDEA